MAVVYLHNARNPPESEDSFVHSRNLSTISNTTLFTSTTLHSQPTEPLLQRDATELQAVDYGHQHAPGTRDETLGHLPCEGPLMIDDNPANEVEKKGYWARNCRRTLNRWKWLKLGLQTCLAAWAVYNTVRYFMAFMDVSDPTIQAFCLALGTSAGFSFSLAFISCLIAILASGSNRLVHGVTHSYLSYVRLTLDYVSSFCLLGPAVVNFALVFIWKDPVDPHFSLDKRCHLDIDVVWSVSNIICNGKSPRWAIWLTLSASRLALTLIMIIGYHSLSSLHGSRRRRAIRGFRPRRLDPSTTDGPSPSSFNLPLHHHHNLTMQHQLSDSTLCGTTMGGGLSPQNQNRIHLARSHSSSLSHDISPTETIAITMGRSANTAKPENERDMNGFLDRFRSMISQVTQETDEALDLAHSAHSTSPENTNDVDIRDHPPPSYEEVSDDDTDDIHIARSHNNDNNNIFNLPPVASVLGYNEFGLPYPPEQNVRVLNGYIRRMPTIESMGSGEAGSSIGASRAGESIFTSSRPPTRNTLLSWNNSMDYDGPSSEPPSRANSLSARAELLVGLSSSTTSEHGELLGRTSPVARRLSTPMSYMDDHLLSDTHSSGGASYHTATMGATGGESYVSPGLTRLSDSPAWEQKDITVSDLESP